MDVKKHVLSEQLSPKGKVFSRLGWGLVASLIVITGLLLSNSLKGPVVGSLFQGSYSVSNATVSPHSTSSSPVSPSNATEELQGPLSTLKRIENNNASKVVEKQEFLEETEDADDLDLEDGVDIDIEGTLLDNSDEGTKNGNSGVGGIQQVAQDTSSVASENGNRLGSNADGVILEKTQFGNFSETVNNATLTGENVNADNGIGGELVDVPGNVNNLSSENSNVDNLSNNVEAVAPSAGNTRLWN